MTRLTLRCWVTAAAGWLRDPWILAALALAAISAATLATTHATAHMPTGDAAAVMLLPLCLAGSAATSLLLPDRRPACARRTAGRRRSAAPGAQAVTAPRPAFTGVGAERGALYSQPDGRRLGQRPAAGTPRTPAAGPTHLAATVPAGGTHAP